jgi:hypothetical protein
MNAMTSSRLDQIELEAAGAPPTMLNLLSNEIRASMAGAADEVQEHAQALLLKLEHLAQAQQATPATTSPAQTYLQPGLILYPELLAAA